MFKLQDLLMFSPKLNKYMNNFHPLEQLKLWVAVARHSFKCVKISIIKLSGLRFKTEQQHFYIIEQ